MNDIQAIGETEIILRNAQTLEIEERIVQKNRITPYIWGQIPWGGSSGSFSDVFYGTYTQNLGINSGFGTATSTTFIRISVNPLINSNAVCGYSDGTYLNSIKADAVIPTVGTGLQVFTAFDSNGPYFQFNGRYNQPASSRNIGAVLLSNRKNDAPGIRPVPPENFHGHEHPLRANNPGQPVSNIYPLRKSPEASLNADEYGLLHTNEQYYPYYREFPVRP